MHKSYEAIAELWRKQGHADKWVEQNSIVIETAMANNMVIAGSFAVGLATKYPRKVPGDLDFVCGSIEEAMAFTNALSRFLSDKSVFYTVRCNNRNKWTAPGCDIHFRFLCPFWKEICIMVIPKVSMFYWKGLRIQPYGTVRSRMEECEEKSPKGRLIPDEDIDIEIEVDDEVKIDRKILQDEEKVQMDDELIHGHGGYN